MMLGWLLAARALASPKFVELPDPSLPEVTVEAIVKLPPLDDHERALLARIVDVVPLGPPEYSFSDLMAITGGRLVRCDVMPDHLAIEVPAYREDLMGAMSVLAGVLENARIDQQPEQSSPVETDPWTTVLHGPLTLSDGIRVRNGEVRDLYQRIFRPEAVTVAASGPFAPGEARRDWELKSSSWQVPKLLFGWPAAQPIPEGSPRVAEIELDAPEMRTDSQDFSATLLAMFALGCGKGGSLFRVAREQDGFSYRQEAVLWPTPSGWLPRLVMAAAHMPSPQESLATLRTQLLHDVQAWTEADRLRAAGLAEGMLLRGIPLSPLYFHSNRPVTGSPYDRAFLAAYWQSKTGSAWDPVGLVGRLRAVSLEELKATASKMVENSTTVVRSPKAGS